MSVISSAAMILAALALLFICIAPNLIMKELGEAMEPRLASAISKALSEDVEAAYYDITEMKALVDERLCVLMMLFSHEDVMELTHALLAAEEISLTGDASQLLAELTAAQSELAFLKQANEARAENLF